MLLYCKFTIFYHITCYILILIRLHVLANVHFLQPMTEIATRLIEINIYVPVKYVSCNNFVFLPYVHVSVFLCEYKHVFSVYCQDVFICHPVES